MESGARDLALPDRKPSVIRGDRTLWSPPFPSPPKARPISRLFGRLGRRTLGVSSGRGAGPRPGCSGVCSRDRSHREGTRTARCSGSCTTPSNSSRSSPFFRLGRCRKTANSCVPRRSASSHFHWRCCRSRGTRPRGKRVSAIQFERVYEIASPIGLLGRTLGTSPSSRSLQGFQDRPRSLPPQDVSSLVVGSLLSGVRFDFVESARSGPSPRAERNGSAVPRVVELATRMGPSSPLRRARDRELCCSPRRHPIGGSPRDSPSGIARARRRCDRACNRRR